MLYGSVCLGMLWCYQIMMKIRGFFFSVVLASASLQPAESRSQPVLIDPMNNETVPVGRDAILQCVVKHLQDYKVLIQF